MRRRLPWILVVVHAAWLLLALALNPYQPYPGPRDPTGFSLSSWHMGTSIMVAGRDLHHDRVAWPLMLLDLPVLLFVGLVLRLFDPWLHPMAASFLVAGGWLLLGSAWWYWIGRAIVTRR